MVKLECVKCSGKGTIRAYSTVKSGICFSCNGTGFHEVNMNNEELKQYKNDKQINSLKVKLYRLETTGKHLKLQLEEKQKEYKAMTNEAINNVGRELTEEEINVISKMCRLNKLTNELNQLRIEYKQTKELINMLEK
jgi:hypothetical protein